MYQLFPGESGSLIMPDMITMILKKFRLKYEDSPGEAALPADQYKTTREGCTGKGQRSGAILSRVGMTLNANMRLVVPKWI